MVNGPSARKPHRHHPPVSSAANASKKLTLHGHNVTCMFTHRFLTYVFITTPLGRHRNISFWTSAQLQK